MNRAQKFTTSTFGRWINSDFGRVFRSFVGVVLLIIGIIFHSHILGIVLILVSLFAISGGIFDVSWVSLALGGKFSGKEIRDENIQLGH